MFINHSSESSAMFCIACRDAGGQFRSKFRSARDLCSSSTNRRIDEGRRDKTQHAPLPRAVPLSGDSYVLATRIFVDFSNISKVSIEEWNLILPNRKNRMRMETLGNSSKYEETNGLTSDECREQSSVFFLSFNLKLNKHE